MEIKIELKSKDFCQCETPYIGEKYDLDLQELRKYCKICGKYILFKDEYCKCEKPIIGKRYTSYCTQEFCTRCGKDLKDGFYFCIEKEGKGDSSWIN